MQGSTAVSSPRFKTAGAGGTVQRRPNTLLVAPPGPAPSTLGGSHRNLQGPLRSQNRLRTAHLRGAESRLLGRRHHSLPVVIRSPIQASRGACRITPWIPATSRNVSLMEWCKGDEFPHAVSGSYSMASARHFLLWLVYWAAG